MSILWLMSHPAESIENECQRCIDKLCCTVYDICSTLNQGREAIVVKPSGKCCDHLSTNGSCSVYGQRETMSGYKENCAGYTCYNLGPPISHWVQSNNIDLSKSAHDIAFLLSRLGIFVTTGNRYSERYTYIKEYLLRIHSTISGLLQSISAREDMEKRFQEWALENSNDPGFDRAIKKLFS